MRYHTLEPFEVEEGGRGGGGEGDDGGEDSVGLKVQLFELRRTKRVKDGCGEL